MKIRFETTVDDIVAFNRFHQKNSATSRRFLGLLSFLVPVIAVVAAGVMAVGILEDRRNDPLLFFVVAIVLGLFVVVVSAGWFLFLRIWFPWLNGRIVRNMLAEGSNRTLLGWREMEIVDGKLNVKTELIHSSLDLRAIEKIVGNEEYTFVYIASIQAFVIPMSLYPEQDYRDFVDDLREAWEDRDLPMLKRAESDTRITERTK